MQFTSARNTYHKHQYRESGFVLVRISDLRENPHPGWKMRVSHRLAPA
jgi:hypothetical protein